MRTAGIICEYNPFHRGHLLQLRKTREMVGEDLTGLGVHGLHQYEHIQMELMDQLE